MNKPKKNNTSKIMSKRTDNKSKASKKQARTQKESRATTKKTGATPSSMPLTNMFRNVPISSAITRMTDEQIITALRKDSKLLSRNAKAYVDNNFSVYFIAIHSWMILLAESASNMSNSMDSAMLTSELVNAIYLDGLVPTITAADQLATMIVECNLQPALFYMRLNDPSYENAVCHILVKWINYFDLTAAEPTAIVLQGLRYLKRFSPDGTEVLESSVLSDFLTLERRIAMGDRRRFNVVNCEQVNYEDRYPLSKMMPNVFGRRAGINCASSLEESIVTQMKELITSVLCDFHMQDGYFSNGAINDGFKVPAAKLSAALCKGTGYLHQPCLENVLNSSRLTLPTYEAKWMTVNKNYKTRRAIAVEEAGRQWYMQGIRLGLEDCLYSRTNITLDDQTRNQILAKKGSATRSLATIDLSAASDHVSWGLVKAVFPPSVFELMDTYRAKYVLLPSGRRQLISKFATSGSALCFPVETLVFWAVTATATECAARWLGNEDDFDTLMNDIAIYGDDIICPTWAAETVIDFLSILGFDINVSKSHYANWDRYRESCGVEYFDGYDVSTRYFPRKTMEFSRTADRTVRDHAPTVVSLCDLQHRMIEAGYQYVSDFLCNIIRVLVPDMTESYIGSEYTDIWSIWPRITKDSWTRDAIDQGRGLHVDYQRDVESHYGLVAKYSHRCTPQEFAYGQAMSYDSWLHHGSKIADDPMAELLRILDAPTDPYAMTSIGTEVLVKLKY